MKSEDENARKAEQGSKDDEPISEDTPSSSVKGSGVSTGLQPGGTAPGGGPGAGMGSIGTAGGSSSGATGNVRSGGV
jgi:hypothetical protein